jgi:hypothetical protein
VDDEETIKAHAPFCHPNIWPEDSDCPGFEHANKECSRVIVRVGSELARHCDDYVTSVDPSFGEKHGLNKVGRIRYVMPVCEGASSTFSSSQIITKARCHKARLLFYFPAGYGTVEESVPLEPGSPVLEDVSSWCGWHNDHGTHVRRCSRPSGINAVTSIVQAR